MVEGSTGERIFDVAVDLFSRRGYAGVSIRDIAREVGIKESSVYHHFRSKEEILAAILERCEAATAATIPTDEFTVELLSAMEPEEFFRRGMEKSLQFGTAPEIEKILRIVMNEQFRSRRAREIVLQTIHRPLAFVEEVLTRLIAAGRVKPLDPGLLAAEYQYPLNALFLEYLLVKYDGGDTAPVERRIAEHISFFWNMVKPEPPQD
ncbi:MAG: TetR/AcrR family transcriptional regulator [Methanocella sp.]